MIEKVKTVIECYFLLTDFKSRGHPRRSARWISSLGSVYCYLSKLFCPRFWKTVKSGLIIILRFIIEGEIAPETFKTELKLEIIPVTTEIEF